MNQVERVLKMLEMLLSGKVLCTNSLDVDKRTAQRDMQILKSFLQNKLYQKERGCYALLDTNNLKTFLQSQQETNKLKEFFEFIALFDEKLLTIFDKGDFPIIKFVQKESKIYYSILERPIENLNTQFLDSIKRAIHYHQYIDVAFHETETKVLKRIKPIKIIFAEGNWYLATITNDYPENNGFKFIRINFITELLLLTDTFHCDVEAESFIKDFQSLFQNYKSPMYQVTLLVASEVSRYFKVKKHLKSQQIIEIKKNGDLVVTYDINNEMEIIPLIKKWIPHIRVISPKNIQQRIKQDINEYLKYF